MYKRDAMGVRMTPKQGSEPVQGAKTGNEQNFDRNRTRTRNEIKFYSSEQNKKIEMAINRLITLIQEFNVMLTPPSREMPARTQL